MPELSISPDIRSTCPNTALGILQAQVKVAAEYPDLDAIIQSKLSELQSRYTRADIHGMPEVASTRAAYKACGKEPSRYRPSAEALLRRVLSGKGLYRVNNVVDALNLVSVSTGFSIGGWDAAKIEGAATLGIGREGEPYQAIGRGELNIAFLPTFRDETGAFGTPTSDSLRTMVQPETTDFLMCFYAFDGPAHLEKGLTMAEELLHVHASATNIHTSITS